MVTFPNAKINLGLNILGKRQDGYHNLVSCFFPVPWQDILEIIPAKKTEITFSGLPIEGPQESNLCMRAYQLMAKDFQLPPVKIHLHKKIPMGAGLGGGSADGAFTLKMLNELFHLFLDPELLQDYAAAIGSDSIFFIKNEPSIVKGRGEVFEPVSLNLKGYYLVIIAPEIHVSTKEAYRNLSSYTLDDSSLRKTIENEPVRYWQKTLKNDFEGSVFKHHPDIRAIKEKLLTEGALYASMTGSGAAVYGIFENQIKDLDDFFPDCTIFSSPIE